MVKSLYLCGLLLSSVVATVPPRLRELATMYPEIYHWCMFGLVYVLAYKVVSMEPNEVYTAYEY